MPEKKELRVLARNRHKDGLRKGDFLTLPRGISGMVYTMEEKSQYIYITLVGGSKGRLPLGSEINITREVPTQAETDLFDMVTVTNEVAKNHEHYRGAINNGLNKLRETHKKKMESGYLDPIDFDLMAQIKLDEMRWAIYEEVRAIMIDVMTREDTPENGAALRAVMRMRYQIEKELTKPYQTALSRSTSVISNLEVDMRRQVRAEFLEETRHWGVESLWERVGTVL